MGRVAARINGSARTDDQCQRLHPLRSLSQQQQQQQPLVTLLESIRENPNLESKAADLTNRLNSPTSSSSFTQQQDPIESKSFQSHHFHPDLPPLPPSSPPLPPSPPHLSSTCCCRAAVYAKPLRDTCCATFACQPTSAAAAAVAISNPSGGSHMYQHATNIDNLPPVSLAELLPDRGEGSASLKDYRIVEQQSAALRLEAATSRGATPVESAASQGISGKFIGSSSTLGVNDGRDRCSSSSCCCDISQPIKPARQPQTVWLSDNRSKAAQQAARSASSIGLSRQTQVSGCSLRSGVAGESGNGIPLLSSNSSSSSPSSASFPDSQHHCSESDCHSGSTRAVRLSRPPSELSKRAMPYANSEQQQQQQQQQQHQQQQQPLHRYRNQRQRSKQQQQGALITDVPLSPNSPSSPSSSSQTSSLTSTRELTKYRAEPSGESNKLRANKSSAKAYESSQQQQQQNKQQKQQQPHHQHEGKGAPDWNNVDWQYIARRYREMPRQHRGQFWWEMRKSCLCHVLLASINSFFPILSSFKNYSLPGHLLTDLMAGFTVAVLHIPQGMAYGMLSGVEPIYGLYVSFVPVLIMALMSKSRHVSYGTFAVISMILASSIDSVRLTLKQQMELTSPAKLPTSEPLIMTTTASSNNLPLDQNPPGLVITNNHQAADPAQNSLRSLLTSSELSDQSPVDSPINVDAATLQNYSTATESSIWSSFNTAQQQTEFVFPTNIEILTCVCLVCGLIQMAMSLSRLGILSLMFSDQLVSGFTTASAINVVTSQLSGLFDLSSPVVPEGLFKICRTWWAFGARLYEGFNQYAAIISLVSILFLLCVKELMEPALRKRFKSITCLPSELVLMSILITASWYWQFEQNLGINVVGHVPTGLPTPQVPRLDLAPLVLKDSITVALVSFAMNLSLAQVYAKKFKYSMDPNQELFALGTSNFVSSFFSCFPCASSLSRSAIQSSMNVRSQLCSLFSCAIVVSIICYFAPILHDLPRCALSCIIIVALKGILVQVRDLGENWRLSKLDALVWLMTFMSVIAFGITYGLIVGVVASLFMMLFRLLTPNHSILGHLQGTEIFVDTAAFSDCREIDQVKIFRFNSALCYLNRTMFKACVEKSLPSIYKQQGFNLFCSDMKQHDVDSDKVKFLIIDCSALAYCDYSGAATLVDIIEELEEHKVSVYLAACPLKLINMIERMQKLVVLEHNVYPTISDAIHCAKYLKRGSFQVT